jgi:UDP-N-acetylmuramate dehydrogenase
MMIPKQSNKQGTTLMNINFGRLASRLAAVAEGEVHVDKPLAPYTSYKIGGPTALWVEPTTENGVGRVLEIVDSTGVPLFVLGRGSNVLISDQGWNGVTLYLGDNLSGWEFKHHEATVLAGTRLMDLTRWTVAQGLAGLELLAGIPGGVGGALRMNAGAFGQEIESVTVSVSGYRRNGSRLQVDRSDIDFSYRRVPNLEDVIITAGRFRFENFDAAKLKTRMEDILALRAKKQPLKFPSCGSVFKRPAGYYAGALIEEAGLKGERVGGAMVSRKHAGFILNVANAAAADVYALIRIIEKRVLERFGVRLDREVKLIGEFESLNL